MKNQSTSKNFKEDEWKRKLRAQMNFEYLDQYYDYGLSGKIICDLLIGVFIRKRNYTIDEFLTKIWGLKRSAVYDMNKFVQSVDQTLRSEKILKEVFQHLDTKHDPFITQILQQLYQ